MKVKSIEVYRRILSYALPYRSRMVFALICMVLVSICAMVPPWLMKNVIDDVLIKKDMFMLNVVAFSLVGVYFIKGFASYGQKYFMAWVGQRVVLDLRVQAYEAMQRMSLKYIYGKRVGELLSRVTNDATVLQGTVTNALVDLVVQSFTTFGMLAFLVYINWKLTVVTFLILPPTVWIINRASMKLRLVGHDIQENLAGLSAIAEEALAAIRIVRSFATEDQEVQRFQSQNMSNFKALMRGTQVNGVLSSVIDLILISVLAGIFWLGGRTVIDGNMTPGELIAFLGYLGFMAHPVTVLTRVISQLQHGLAAAERIFGLLDHEESIKLPDNPVFFNDMKGHIVFEDLSFRYENEGKWVLKNLNLEIPSGATVAIVGPTGTGKSTLVDLVQRFYDPDKGRVLIDGLDLRKLDLVSLRRQIGVVPQDPVLMKGSFRYNIAYGCDRATEKDIKNAASIAEISSFIESLPEGYDTEIGERGVTLSGGQRQRVAIARAIVRDPKIIIMDEATSSLDAEVERQIQTAMDRAMEGRTSLVIAHRLSTIRSADKIVYLDGGNIVEEGSHEELLLKGGAYSRLYHIQSGDVYDEDESHR